MFCPAMCSGKGVCDWDADPIPECKCFSANDTTAGCFDSPLNDPSTAFQSDLSVFVSGVSLALISGFLLL